MSSCPTALWFFLLIGCMIVPTSRIGQSMCLYLFEVWWQHSPIQDEFGRVVFSPGNSKWFAVSLLNPETEPQGFPSGFPPLSGGSVAPPRSWLALGWGMALAVPVYSWHSGLRLLIFGPPTSGFRDSSIFLPNCSFGFSFQCLVWSLEVEIVLFLFSAPWGQTPRMLVTDVRMRGARKYEQGGRGGISNYGFLTPRRGVALGECWLGAGESHLIWRV